MSSDTEQSRKVSVFTSMTGTGRRLKRWEKADLITRDQMIDILDFEKHHQGKKFFRSLIGLALFAIAAGILSLVGANWLYMTGSTKVALHLILNIVVAFVVWTSARSGNKIWREGSIFLFFALNLTFIALIGQVYQLGGNYAAALGVWMVISSPAVFMYGKTPINAVPWIIALLVTISAILFEITKLLDEDIISLLLCIGVGLYMPLLLMLSGVSKKIHSIRPGWANASFVAGIIILVFQGMMGSFMWYADVGREIGYVLEDAGSVGTGYVMMLVVILVAPAAVYGYERIKSAAGEKITDRSAITFIIGSIISATLPLILMTPEIEFVGAIHFILYWCFAGWMGNRMGFNQLVSLAITMVTIRIIIVYCELFGDMITTGFGLIFSGILGLAVLKGAVTFKNRVVAK
jgi:hypothetical protein